MRISRLLWYAYGEPLVIAVPTLIVVLVVVNYWDSNSLVVRMAASIMAVIVFTTFFGLVFSTEQEKQLVKTILRSVCVGVHGMISPSG